MAEKKRGMLGNIGMALSKGAAAFGQGLTGADYLGAIEDQEKRMQEYNAEQDSLISLTEAKKNLIKADPSMAEILQPLESMPAKDQISAIKSLVVDRAKGPSAQEQLAQMQLNEIKRQKAGLPDIPGAEPSNVTPAGNPATDRVGPNARYTGEGLPPRYINVPDSKYGGTKIEENPEWKKAVDREAKMQDKQMTAELNSVGKIAEQRAEKYGQAARLVGMYQTLQGQFKRIDEDFPGGTGNLAWAAYKLASNPLAPRGLQLKAFPLMSAMAQREETTIAAMPIISGQARYVQSLADKFGEIIPEISREPEIRDDLMAQSVRNTMTLVYGIENGYFTAEKMKEMGVDPNGEARDKKEAMTILRGIQLKPEQEEAIKVAIDDVLSTETIRDTEAARSGVKKTPTNKQTKLSADKKKRLDEIDAELARLKGGK